MFKIFYIIFSLSSFCLCQAADDFFSLSTSSPVVQRAYTTKKEDQPLPRIVFHYLPNETTFISHCGVESAIQLIDASLISLILQKIYYPSLLQSNFSLKVEKVENTLNDELSKAKVKWDAFKEIIETTEQRFFQRGYIPYLSHQVQRKISAETKVIVSGKVITEYDCLLFIANDLLCTNISLVADKVLFFCQQYKSVQKNTQRQVLNADEVDDIEYLHKTISLIPGKRPCDYTAVILRGLREELTFFKQNGEQRYITAYEDQVRRFEDDEYLERLILKIQLSN